ncbi:hypothetical protein [Algoriphagus sp.]|uniref:hypothetical protein n=1 Tax=Algoriphagus sp. TaxID=1872435 RepID=UPI0025F5819C|nr:hypothetical protein [Algoriphagus sp.]
MKFFNYLFLFFLLTVFTNSVNAQENPESIKNDTITLAQAYMNLYLTETYFDTLDRDRISKILAFEKGEIGKINNRSFITNNKTLFNFTQSLFFYLQTKQITTNSKNFERNTLRRIKSVFDQAIESYNSSDIDDVETFLKERNALYEMINFNQESNNNLNDAIWELKSELNSLFVEDIYPDFKRIFYKAKLKNEFEFDSLTYFSKLYDMPLSMAILENELRLDIPKNKSNFISPNYTVDNRLELISRYMQLKYLATSEKRIPRNFDTDILYKNYGYFMKLLGFEDDEFIKKELNPTACDLLLRQLKSKFPKDESDGILNESFSMVLSPSIAEPQMYFFPNPAPLASASSINANFKPELATLNQVDLFLKGPLENAGYKNQLHYYYDLDGFALTTSLEKFNLNGASIPSKERFTENLGGDGKFSYFEIFKSIFFDVESEYRMFAFIVASKAASMSNQVMTISFAEELLKNSYDSLPEVLKERVLANKTLSIFIYHFHQNDIGQVPELDLSGKLTVQDHLRSARINQIIQ